MNTVALPDLLVVQRARDRQSARLRTQLAWTWHALPVMPAVFEFSGIFIFFPPRNSLWLELEDFIFTFVQ